MRLQVKGKNLEVSDAIRAYAEQKLAKVGKQLGELVQVELELSAERNPSLRANQVAEAIELEPPFRAEAVRRSEAVWAVAARRIAVVRLEGVEGEELELTLRDGERTLLIDGRR